MCMCPHCPNMSSPCCPLVVSALVARYACYEMTEPVLKLTVSLLLYVCFCVHLMRAAWSHSWSAVSPMNHMSYVVHVFRMAQNTCRLLSLSLSINLTFYLPIYLCLSFSVRFSPSGFVRVQCHSSNQDWLRRTFPVSISLCPPPAPQQKTCPLCRGYAHWLGLYQIQKTISNGQVGLQPDIPQLEGVETPDWGHGALLQRDSVQSRTPPTPVSKLSSRCPHSNYGVGRVRTISLWTNRRHQLFLHRGSDQHGGLSCRHQQLWRTGKWISKK